MAIPVCVDIVGIIDFRQRIDLPQAVIHRQHLHASGRTDIIVTVRTADNIPDGIAGKSAALVNHIHNLLVDRDGKSVVVRTDPQPALFIHIQGIHIPDGFIVHIPELPAVVPVKPGIGTDPQNAVVGLCDIVCLAARQAIRAGIDRLHIIVVFVRP